MNTSFITTKNSPYLRPCFRYKAKAAKAVQASKQALCSNEHDATYADFCLI